MKAVLILLCSTLAFANQSHKMWQLETTVPLANKVTSQKCSFHKAPTSTGKQHVISMDPIVGDGSQFVHHIDVFRCSPPTGVSSNDLFGQFADEKVYDCNSKEVPSRYCRSYWEWACCIGPICCKDGVPEFVKFPKSAGIPLYPDEYLMMQVHYENPELKSGVVVDTGLHFEYTSVLRKGDAGFLEIGQYDSYKNVIPPDSTHFKISHTCQSDCTGKLDKTINIFDVTLHGHHTAKEMKLRHFRNGKELNVIAHDVVEATGLNSQRADGESQILPGDELQVECVFDTTSKNGKATVGGMSENSEMCIAFIQYYPKTSAVEKCGSTLSTEALHKFFGLNEVDTATDVNNPTILSPEKLRGKSFTEIVEQFSWTTESRNDFQELMSYGPREGYCTV